ncbi:MAG: putative addiction module antidote protein [Candidatus Dadabacteria bacterium]|nr:putative addiction module antidote protein [Candidatus Dadabacteria bacterium]
MKKVRNLVHDVCTKTLEWDAADYLDDPEEVVAYLEAAFEDGDSRVITSVLGDIARAKGMTAVAAKAGVGRESLYKALSRDGNPAFASVLSVMKAMGLRLHPVAEDQTSLADASLRL